MSNLLSRHFLSMAYNNAWSNHRLLKACALLSQTDFVAHRTSFFPSIKATLNHILTVDWFYIDALEREQRNEPPHPQIMSFFDPEEPFDTCADLQREQRLADRRLIDYCAHLTDNTLGRQVTLLRPRATQQETQRGCSDMCSSTRSIIVGKCMRCLPEHQSHRRRSMNFSAISMPPCAPWTSPKWA